MATRTVHCAKLGAELPGLEKPPFPGPLGEEIFNRVSADAWRTWQDEVMIKVINEYRLNMADKRDYEMLLQQLRAFLNLGGGEGGMVEIENAQRGKQ